MTRPSHVRVPNPRPNTAVRDHEETAGTAGSETADAQSRKSAGAEAFPYPAKTPSGCRFPGEPEISNFQEYGEEPIEMRKDDFKEWWFFSEDSDKPCWSYVGTDNQNRCILQRRYRYGTPDHYTFEPRHFLIKRNIMASAFALALIQDNMERRNYFELMERLNKQFPPTGNPEIDGPEILLPPQELLDKPSKEEIEEAIEYAACDFRCDRVLYEGVALLLGHFDIYTGTRQKADGEKVYALAFGYPHNGTDMYEYYLITREEYMEYMEWEERRLS